MENVRMDEFIYPCAIYAMRRAGLYMTLDRFLNYPRTDLPEDMGTIPKGSILFWENAEKEKEWRLSVEGQTVLTTYTYNRGHYAVYEGDGLISDLSWTNNGGPFIRFRKLQDVMRPDKILASVPL